jgi:hypothetical protein
MTSFTLSNNLKTGVASLLKTLFIVSCTLYVFFCILLITKKYFSTEARTMIIVISAIPAFSFALALYFHENYLVATNQEFYFEVKSFFCILLLLFPPFAFAFRYNIFDIDKQSLITVMASSFLIFIFIQVPLSQKLTQLENHSVGKFFIHMRFVMWSFWDNKEIPLIVSNYNKDIRKRHYANIHDLKVFQQTLTCAIPDSQCALNMIPQQWSKKNLAVLDIGGGDGVFSKLLLEGLKKKGCSFSRLVMIDPANWDGLYKKNLSSIIAENKIEIIHTTFKDYEKRGNIFDFVIASHSLYSELDLYENRIEEIFNNVIIPLKSLVRKNGIMIATLASMKGISYRFKKQSLGLLFGKSIVDATSELLWQAFQNDRHSIELECSDSAFDLTDLWYNYKTGQVDQLYSWLNYFLRYDMNSISNMEKDMLIEFLNNNLLKFDRLCNVQKDYFRKFSSTNFNESSFVLPHKIEVLKYVG